MHVLEAVLLAMKATSGETDNGGGNCGQPSGPQMRPQRSGVSNSKPGSWLASTQADYSSVVACVSEG